MAQKTFLLTGSVVDAANVRVQPDAVAAEHDVVPTVHPRPRNIAVPELPQRRCWLDAEDFIADRRVGCLTTPLFSQVFLMYVPSLSW